MVETKTCTRCKETKPLSGFYVSKGKVHVPCKACTSVRSREHYTKNREKVLARNRAWVAANKEAVLVQQQAWRAANKKHKAASGKAWALANKERKVALDKAWNEANKERAAASRRAWKKANPDKVLFYFQQRKHRERTAPGGPFYPGRVDYKLRIKEFHGLCAYCLKAPYTELDHAIPLSRGGTNYPDNVWPCCLPCNRNKKAKILFVEWVPPCLVGDK